MKTEPELRELASRALAFHLAARGQGGMLHRDMEIDELRIIPADPNGTQGRADDRIEISISSETPVERYDYWADERYLEILSHSPDAVDLSRSVGAPFLADHDARDWRSQMGKLVNVRLDQATRKVRAEVVFSQRGDAQDFKRDIADGIRTKISAGYRVDENNIEVTKPENGTKTVRYNRWQLLEGSSVAIPADESVGVGRAYEGLDPADTRRLRELITTLQSQPSLETRTMPPAAAAAPDAGAGAAPAAPAVDLTVVRTETRDEIKRISELARTHKMIDRLPEWLEKHLDEAAVRAEILAIYQANRDKAVADPAVIELSDKERKQYDLRRGIMSALISDIDGRGRQTSFETEISDELEKRAPAEQKRHGGLWIPTCTSKELARAHNSANTGAPMDADLFHKMRTGLYNSSGVGAEVVFKVPGEWLVLLRNYMALYQAGVSYMTGLQGPVAFPQQATAASGSWVAENPGSDVSDSNLTLDQVLLQPNTYQASTSYSRQLWVQSVVDIDGIVKQDLAAINALALDEAGIAGTGSSNQPTGITTWSGTSSYAMGTNGGTPGAVDLVNMETLITAANADQWPLAYLVHPKTRGTFKKAVPLANTIGLPVFTDGAGGNALEPGLQSGGGSRKRGFMNGYDTWTSAQVPSALTKGSSSGIRLAGIFGAFPTMVIGDWGMFEIIVDPYRLKKQGMIELTSFAMYGIALKYPAAFAVCKDFLV